MPRWFLVLQKYGDLNGKLSDVPKRCLCLLGAYQTEKESIAREYFGALFGLHMDLLITIPLSSWLDYERLRSGQVSLEELNQKES